MAQIVTGLIIAVIHSWRLTLLLLGLLPLFAICVTFISKNLPQAFQLQQNELSIAAKHINQALHNATLIAVTETRDHEVQRFCSILSNVSRYMQKSTTIFAYRQGFTKLATTLTILAALSFGTFLVHNDYGTTGLVVTSFS